MVQTHRRPAILLAAIVLSCTRGGDPMPLSKGAAAPVAPARAAADTTDPHVARADLARITGDSSARVWLVVVSDFQCPYCKMWQDQTYPAIEKEYLRTGRIRMAYVNFPLGIHPNAVPAAEAAMCAGAQGKFWEYHDRLFAEQTNWAPMSDPSQAFDRMGRQLGLDSTAFAECRKSHLMLPMIQADRRRATSRGVNSTPIFFIDSRSVEGAQPFSVFKPVLDAALAQAPKDTVKR